MAAGAGNTKHWKSCQHSCSEFRAPCSKLVGPLSSANSELGGGRSIRSFLLGLVTMRLSWFAAAQLRRRAQRSRRSTAATLRVRQLERRRVLDAAAQSLVVSAVTSAQLPPAADTQASDT